MPPAQPGPSRAERVKVRGWVRGRVGVGGWVRVKGRVRGRVGVGDGVEVRDEVGVRAWGGARVQDRARVKGGGKRRDRVRVRVRVSVRVGSGSGRGPGVGRPADGGLRGSSSTVTRRPAGAVDEAGGSKHAPSGGPYGILPRGVRRQSIRGLGASPPPGAPPPERSRSVG